MNIFKNNLDNIEPMRNPPFYMVESNDLYNSVRFSVAFVYWLLILKIDLMIYSFRIELNL